MKKAWKKWLIIGGIIVCVAVAAFLFWPRFDPPEMENIQTVWLWTERSEFDYDYQAKVFPPEREIDDEEFIACVLEKSAKLYKIRPQNPAEVFFGPPRGVIVVFVCEDARYIIHIDQRYDGYCVWVNEGEGTYFYRFADTDEYYAFYDLLYQYQMSET